MPEEGDEAATAEESPEQMLKDAAKKLQRPKKSDRCKGLVDWATNLYANLQLEPWTSRPALGLLLTLSGPVQMVQPSLQARTV